MFSINFTNCLVDSIGIEHGLTEPELFGMEARLRDAHESVLRQANAGKLGFVDLPNNTEEAKKIMSWARKTKAVPLRHPRRLRHRRQRARQYRGSGSHKSCIYWNLSDKKAYAKDG